MQNKVSVILSTLGRSRELKKAIDAILKAKPYEVIVVIPKGIRLKLKKSKVKVINQTKKGLSNARNTGIQHAKGDIIAFTDDDCIVDRNWITEIQRCMSNNDIVCCTGRTIPHKMYKNPKFEKNFKFDKGKSEAIFSYKIPVNIFKIGSGNNMAFKKSVFKYIGLFDEEFGLGSKYPSEDIDMFYRILKKGGRIAYSPKMIVYHKYICDVKKRSFEYGVGFGGLIKKHTDINVAILAVGVITKLLLQSLVNPIKREYLKGIFKGILS